MHLDDFDFDRATSRDDEMPLAYGYHNDPKEPVDYGRSRRLLGLENGSLGLSEYARVRPTQVIELYANARNSEYLSQYASLITALSKGNRTYCIFDNNADDALLKKLTELEEIVSSNPVEEGVNNPGEQIAKQLIADFGEGDCLEAIFKLNSKSALVSFVKLIGRLGVSDPQIRAEFVGRCLQTENIEIRDAIVQAIDLWQDMQSIDILRPHVESCDWLGRYISQILEA